MVAPGLCLRFRSLFIPREGRWGRGRFFPPGWWYLRLNELSVSSGLRYHVQKPVLAAA